MKASQKIQRLKFSSALVRPTTIIYSRANEQFGRQGAKNENPLGKQTHTHTHTHMCI